MNPTIEQIIKANALSMSNVEVILDSRFPTVTIIDDSGEGMPNIFLDGHEAEEFAKQVGLLWLQNPTITEDEAAKHVAMSLVECCWG